MYSNLDELVSSRILNLRTLEDKQNFYKQNGFIIEPQIDEQGNKLLAIYNGKFDQPYSVHFKNLSTEIQSKIDECYSNSTETIAHVKIGSDGLTKLGTLEYKIRDQELIMSPGFYDKKPVQSYPLFDCSYLLWLKHHKLDNYIP